MKAPRRNPYARAGALALAGALAVGSASDAGAKPAKHRPKKPRVVEEAGWAETPAARYAALGSTACLRELRQRKIAFSEVERARGVAIPIRLKGALGGVLYRTELPADQRAETPHEVMDCRLALPLHDLSASLAKRDIEEVHIFSAWRPPPASWPADQHAIRHPGGLAIDVRRLIKRAAPGSKPTDLVVERDWKPARGQAPCSKEARAAGNAREQELRAIFCEADAQRLFTSMLSPNYDKAHENHFHLELRPEVKWRLVL